jgi:hypothetical protein
MGHTQSQEVFPLIQMTATLGINNQVSENLGITIKLKITSQVTNFIKQIFSFLACGGSIVKTLN